MSEPERGLTGSKPFVLINAAASPQEIDQRLAIDPLLGNDDNIGGFAVLDTFPIAPRLANVIASLNGLVFFLCVPLKYPSSGY